MAFETELKLAIAAQDVPALLAHPLLAAEPSQRQRLVSTYFDTPKRTLLARRVAVRERRVGRQTLLTVKTAGSVIGGLARRGGGEGLGDEGPRLLCAGGADTAWPDAEVVLAAHGRDSAHRVKQMKSRKKRCAREVRENSAPRE